MTKAPPVSISCRDLSLRFPVYGVDAKSLKKYVAKITVGGKLDRLRHAHDQIGLRDDPTIRPSQGRGRLSGISGRRARRGERALCAFGRGCRLWQHRPDRRLDQRQEG